MLTLAALVDRAATARRPVEAGSRSAGRRHRHHGQQGHQHRSHRRLPSSPGVCPRVPKCARGGVGRQPFRRSDLGFCTFPTCSTPSKTPSQGGGTGSNPVRAAKKRPGQRPSSEGLFPFLAAMACAPCARLLRCTSAQRGAVRSAHRVHTPEVAGSSPAAATEDPHRLRSLNAWIAPVAAVVVMLDTPKR